MTDEFGYIGPNVLFELGTRAYVRSFFLAIEKYVFKEKLYRQLDWSLITDRLYKRTVPHEQLDAMISSVAQMLSLMAETPLSAVDWSKLGLDGPHGTSADNLGAYYENFGRGLIDCALSLGFGQLRGTEYPPVRLGSHYHYIHEKSRPPEAYEALGPKDLPFWLRDDIDYPEVRRTPVEGTGGIATIIDILPPNKS
jgi:hypothetical protein